MNAIEQAIEQAIEALEYMEKKSARSQYQSSLCLEAIAALQSQQGEAVELCAKHSESNCWCRNCCPPAQPKVPEGYATVEIKQLETLKGLLNAMSAFTAESMVDTMLAASQQPTTRTHLPAGTDRVRNVATGEVKSVGQEQNDG
jgi:hypothetical protein